MSYPAPGAYQEAVQFPQTAFTDPELAGGEPMLNALGLPQPITGAFAAVFPIQTPHGRYAAKCFLRRVDDQQVRYQALSRHLKQVALPHMVAYQYQPEGIHVDGHAFPLLKMAWVDGQPLNRYIEDHLDDADRLSALSGLWSALLTHLDAAGVAHGDLQHGNVLVVEDEQVPGSLGLKLVDYDAMFVPALAGRKSTEVGQRNYQHPDRSPSDFGARLDRFSGLVIYVALEAVRLEPSLWDAFNIGENLLFQAHDFFDPAQSSLFERLSGLEPIAPLVRALKTACFLEPLDAPSLAEVLEGTPVKRPIHGPRRRREGDWRRARPPEAPLERLALPILLAVVVLTIALAVAGRIDWAVGCALVGLVALGVIGTWGYRQQEAVQRRMRLEQMEAYVHRVIRRLHEERQRVHLEQTEVRESHQALRARRLQELQDQSLHDRLRYHFIGELEDVEGVSHKAVVRLKKAGIRSAYHLTEKNLQRVVGLGDESRARLQLWRRALVRQYHAHIPEALSPAEEQRLVRHIERRLEQLRAEADRLEEKVRVQQEEVARLRQRSRTIPEVTPGAYVRFLLRMASLPRLPQS